MIRPCNITLNGCPGADSPITNLSAEAPDPFMFAGAAYDLFNPYTPAPLGYLYYSRDCHGVVWSAESQAAADLLARNQASVCSQPPGGSGTPAALPFPPFPPFPTFSDTVQPFNWTPPPFVPPASPAFQQFTNADQSATVSCPNGAVFSYTVRAGSLLSALVDPSLGPVMVELLNAEALSFALSIVWSLRVCLDIPLLALRIPPANTPLPPPDWPPGVAWPVVDPDPVIPPPNWPANKQWPPPSQKGPTVAANPGWACAGSELDPELSLYVVSGSGSYTFSLTGSVPPGTSLEAIDGHTAQLSGAPSTPGEYTYTVQAQKNGDPSVSVQVTDTLKVFGMITTGLPGGTVGIPYGPVQLQAAGTAPITFSLIGSLPDGLSLSAGGAISGTPTTAGSSGFTVQFTDAENGSCQQPMSISVTGGTCPPLDWTQLVWNQTVGTGLANWVQNCWNNMGDPGSWFLQIGLVRGVMPASGCVQNAELSAVDTWQAVGGANPRSYNVSIFLGATTVLNHDYTVGDPVGSVPFTIPAQTGQIEVYVTWQNSATSLCINNTP